MILISHRGNTKGPIPEAENRPDYIEDTLKTGYDVEIDVWYIDGTFYLGHDLPQYAIDKTFLYNSKLWVHCKNVAALEALKFENINYFWHETDTVTLTSKRYIWAHPGKQPLKNSIAVLPELYNDTVEECLGVCSDYIQNYKL